ncbi:MAG: PQQ-binding-like beta-propeller repeat protein [Dehalococcoidia bacterium]|nr:PQQ-binding-like beta-propeller repeat protein [Dehalococcoidia bacterium]
MSSIGVCPSCSNSREPLGAAYGQLSAPSVDCIDTLGISGDVIQVVAGGLTEGGPVVVLLATSDGLYAVSDGTLLWQQPRVHCLALVDDVSGDGAKDLVICRGSSICGCDGTTGEMLWQVTPRQRVFGRDLGWSDWGFDATDLQVIGTRGSQIVAVASGQCLFGISALDGTVLWRFRGHDRLFSLAAIPDQDGDGTDEVVVGTETGFIRLVSGDSGRAKWKKKVGEKWTDEYGQLMYGWAGSIAGLHGRSGAVVIGTHDGRVCLLDLGRGKIEWESRVAGREDYVDVRAWPVADVTGDGLPEILADVGAAAAVAGEPSPRGVALLNGASGERLWATEIYFWGTLGSRVAYLDGQPVVLESHPDSGLRMISLRDGSTARSLKVTTLDGKTPQAMQLCDSSYLTFSNDSDLAVVSADGSVQWHYPRVSSVSAARGRFSTDNTPDLLARGECAQHSGEATATRVISVLDGATHKAIWRYEIPPADFAAAGGLLSVQAADDLTGDGIQDVVAYSASTVFRFDGVSGSLTRFEVGESIVDLQLMKIGANATALLVGIEDGVLILDKDGNRLWESAYADWGSAEPGAVRVLNDLNQDGTDDLVMFLADCIVVARSIGSSPLGFEIRTSILAGDNKVIEMKELVGDINGDGVQEIAYLEYEQGGTSENSVLLVVSPVGGEVWHRWDMPVTVDIACADFNGDGFPDSLLHCRGPKKQEPTWTPFGMQNLNQTKLEVYSGKDDSVLWSLSFAEDWWNAGGEKMPAAPVGDISGDGIEDLAVCSIRGTYTGGNAHETKLSAYSVVSGSLVKEVTIPEVQEDDKWLREEKSEHGPARWYGPGPGDEFRSAGDLNGDGIPEVSVLAGYNRYTADKHVVALVDVLGERVLYFLSSFMSLSLVPPDVSEFAVLTAGGSVYSFRAGGSLRVTSPVAGSTTGSPVDIAWEGTDHLALAEVFVDGQKNAQTRSSQIDLRLHSGTHRIVIRSTDQCGVVSYAAADFEVSRGLPWVSCLTGLAVAALLALYFSGRWAGLVRRRWGGRRGP